MNLTTEKNKLNIKDVGFDKLVNLMLDINQSKYRALQIFEWIYKHKVDNFDDMSNISKDAKERLREKFFISKMSIKQRYLSKIDNTVKYLLQLGDGGCVEAVLMEYEHGCSVCVSTQVGCRMGCDFCASSKMGFARNLTSGEIVDQVLTVIRDSGRPVSNVVLMGIGEPLDNYENVLEFLGIAGHHKGLNIGQRHMALSTCGLADKILKLADCGFQYMLSVSLHAVEDSVRSSMMPVNKKYGISELLSACRYYIQKTNRRVSFQYALIDGLNDTPWHAERLVRLLGKMLCYVNLIPINSIKCGDGSCYKKSNLAKVKVFRDRLMKGGIVATIRRELGSDINAACGQLRAQWAE